MIAIDSGTEFLLENEKLQKSKFIVGKPIYVWVADKSEIEDGALVQLIDASNHPCLFHHASAMPDVHQGYGLPIGGVVAFHDGVSPYCVGKDKGCGMHFVLLSHPWEEITREQIVEIRRRVREMVPMGPAKAHDEPQEWKGFNDYLNGVKVVKEGGWFSMKKWNWFKRCLGTLGGGNHFIEIQAASTGGTGLMIHSGSRNVGETFCTFHHAIAVEHNLRWKTQLPTDRLAFLPTGTELCDDYLRDMEFALAYARENRRRMMDATLVAVESVLGSIKVEMREDVHHNYASLEHHLGKNVWVHRKGATSARKGELGIIPGSQGSASYIVRGKGNPLSFTSCPHGAGRAFGRKDACRSLDAETETKRMEGVVHDSWDTTVIKIDGEQKVVPDLGEATGAYKDISVVMQNATDLCDVEIELRPLGNLKGKDTEFNKRLKKKVKELE